MSAVPSGGNTLKNVIIGIGTTVAAYAIVHFLGLGKSNEEEKLQKDATVNAFKSINDYKNYASQKFKTIACFSCDEQEMKNEMLRELDKNSISLRTLKEDKNIDEKMKSVIDRTIDQFNDLKPIYSSYFDSLTYAKQLPLDDQVTVGLRIQQTLFSKAAYIQTRDTGDVNNYLKDINKKFKTKLVFKDIEQEYDISALTGKWKVECSFELDIKKDGTLIWTEKENEFKGKWTLNGKLLTINLDTKQEFRYNIFQISKKILIIYNEESGGYLGACPE
ncbi:MAG: hypothetical protein ABUL41_02370 [Chitinophagaceae bacterium]